MFLIDNLSRRFEELTASYNRLSARERGMVLALALTALLIIVGGGAAWALSSLDDLAQENETTRTALRELRRLGEKYRAKKAEIEALNKRMSTTPLELHSYVETAASQIGVKIDESRETKAVTTAEYLIRGLEIKLRKLNIGQFAALLGKLEGNTSHLVQITRIEVTSRYGKHDELDVGMVVSSYQQTKGRVASGRAAGSGQRGSS